MSQKVIRLMLEKLDYDVFACENGKEAEELYFSLPEEFCCALLDFEMPKQNGPDTAKIIRKNNPKFPIIMLTAHSAEQDKELSLNSGATEFLTKPVPLQILKEALVRCTTMDNNNND